MTTKMRVFDYNGNSHDVTGVVSSDGNFCAGAIARKISKANWTTTKKGRTKIVMRFDITVSTYANDKQGPDIVSYMSARTQLIQNDIKRAPMATLLGPTDNFRVKVEYANLKLSPEIHNTIKQAIKEARQNASSITRDERLYVVDEDVIGTPDEILEYAEINIDSASNGTVDSEGVQTAGDETTVKTKIEEEFAM